MNETTPFATISRRDAIRLVASIPASGALLAGIPLEVAACVPERFAAAGASPAAGGVERMAALSIKDFESLVGDKFIIAGEEVTLSDVREGPKSAAGFRQQFALTFKGPRIVSSEIVSVAHPAIGRHELHVTQINDSTAAALEICFS
jgi:hypothetical protein